MDIHNTIEAIQKHEDSLDSTILKFKNAKSKETQAEIIKSMFLFETSNYRIDNTAATKTKITAAFVNLLRFGASRPCGVCNADMIYFENPVLEEETRTLTKSCRDSSFCECCQKLVHKTCSITIDNHNNNNNTICSSCNKIEIRFKILTPNTEGMLCLIYVCVFMEDLCVSVSYRLNIKSNLLELECAMLIYTNKQYMCFQYK